MTDSVHGIRSANISEVNSSACIYRVFHEDFSSVMGTNAVLCAYKELSCA